MSTTTATLPQIINDLSNEAYHADGTRESKSRLWDFWESPELYERTYIKRDAPKRKTTPEMELGTLTHACVLEPDTINRYAIKPHGHDGRTKEGKAWNEANAHKPTASQDQWVTANGMAASVKSLVDEWFTNTPRIEATIHWTDIATGIMCRCRPDFLVETPDQIIIADLKTCADASKRGFRIAVEQRGYWMQDAFYSFGAEAFFHKPALFFFIAVESSFPYRCAIHELRPADRDAARYHTTATLESLAAARASNTWSDGWTRQCHELTLSRYAFSRGEE